MIDLFNGKQDGKLYANIDNVNQKNGIERQGYSNIK